MFQYIDLKATELVAYVFFALLFAAAFGIGFWLEGAEKKHKAKAKKVNHSNSDLV